jgi:hypothetical protein
LIAVIAVVGILAIIVGILYFVAGSSLPHFMVAGSHVKSGSHLARGGVSLVVGLVLLGFAWLTARKK